MNERSRSSWMRRRRATRSNISLKKPLRSPIRKRAARRPDGSTRSTRARRTTREAGIRQRSIVGRRLVLEDAEIITKYTFPFVDAEWRVPFTVVDRVGGPPRVLEGAIRVDGDRLHAPGRVADLRPVESIPADRFAELAHFDPWWAFRGVSGLDRRSEEHTSELQSRPHLVCRLLLEKKKIGWNATLTAIKNHSNPTTRTL